MKVSLCRRAKKGLKIVLAVATILGGIAAISYFVDKWYATSTPVNPSPSVADRAPPGIPSSTTQTEMVPPPNTREKQAAPESRHAETALPLEAVLGALRDSGMTALQKSQFTQRQEGRSVVWTGKVQRVQKMSEHDPNSDIVVALASTTADQYSIPDLVMAIFPSSEASMLTQFSRGDVVVIEGTLHFHELAGSWSASLTNSRFVRFITRSSDERKLSA